MGSNLSSVPTKVEQSSLPESTELEMPSIESEQAKETLETESAKAKGTLQKEKEDGEKIDEEEEEECGFCVFMKGGACRDAFIQWNDCVLEDEDKKDEVAIKCSDKTVALMNCMQANPDYYAPILKAEKEIDDEFDRETQKDASQSSTEASDSSDGSTDPGNL